MEESKPKKSGIVPVLVGIVIALAVALLYTALKPALLNILKTESTEPPAERAQEQQTATEQPATETAAEREVAPQTETTTKTQAVDHSGDIDKDLQSLDSLDLSTAENDFGDDKLSGL